MLKVVLMKITETFIGWFDYQKDEFELILKQGLISFDTNVFLNLYRYVTEVSKETLSLFDKIKERLVISYYVAYEFTKNRKKVALDSLSEYEEYKNKILKKYGEIVDIFNDISNNKMVNKNKFIENIEKNRDEIIKSIDNEKKEKEKLFDEGLDEKICELIDNRIIEKYQDNEFELIRSEGIRRQKEQIPPGYKDVEKGENADYYIFQQLIDYSKKENKDMIFVTDDVKVDMFQNVHGKKSPRPELLQEFYEKTGKKIIILTLQEFMNNKIIFKGNVSNEMLDEIKKYSRINQIENEKLTHTIKKLKCKIFKYNDSEEVKTNIELITDLMQELIRKIEIFGGKISTSKYQLLLFYLSNYDIDSYMNESLDQRKKVKSIRLRDFDRLTNYYELINIRSQKGIVISAISDLIEYVDCFLEENIENKMMRLRLRRIKNISSVGEMKIDQLVKEFNYVYDFLLAYGHYSESI